MGIQDDLRMQWRMGGALMRLILVNVGVFVVLRLTDLLFFLFGSTSPNILSWLWGNSDLWAQLRAPWTVVTYMFTHWGIGHIFFNLLVLWFIGRIFQDLLGGKRLLGNYLLGGFTGLALFLLSYNLLPAFHERAGTPIVGASAAVMSIFIGLATYRPDLSIHLLIVGEVRLKWIALIYVVVDLVSIREGDNSGGHIAHIGGALYGYFASQQLKRGRDWSMRFVGVLEAIGRTVQGNRKSKMRVEKKFTPASADRDALFNAAKQEQQARVDTILDKISRSGYDSLSKDEKDFLFRASGRH